ncbi:MULTISPECIES: porin [Ramlibacter]|uniref:Porin n=1 Tax=Ramlibacter aquaticus TaxID=2780094 RepID=A0ABR9S9W7_9BURK|nr:MULTISPECIES: porin [Ramlibacter]MBE7939144.1 porin [Ramlibacter aquaticus]
MKNFKTGLVAAAVLALAAGSASAQSSVQVQGLLDVYAGSIRMAGDGASTSTLGSGGMTTSWWGVKGSEDLGAGLKANFALTSFLQVNSGLPGRFPGDTFFARDANVGLSGSFGSLALGRNLAPNFLPTIIFNPFGDSFTFSPLVLHANVPLFNGTNWGATTPSDTGWSNELLYTTPNYNGLSANVHYQLANSSSSAHNVGINALYFNGPFAATAFYERDQLNNPVVSQFSTKDVKKDWMVGASYDFKVVKLFGTYGKAESDDAALPSAKTLSLGASAPLGAGSLMAAWAKTKLSTGEDRKTASFGYDYFLSKQTDLYAALMRDEITGASSGTSFGVGIRKRF